jgi:hypothetical protein
MSALNRRKVSCGVNTRRTNFWLFAFGARPLAPPSELIATPYITNVKSPLLTLTDSSVPVALKNDKRADSRGPEAPAKE